MARRRNPADAYYAGLTGMNRYAMPLLATWREVTGGQPADEVPFTKDQVVAHAKEILRRRLTSQKDVKNVPDIVYTFRARADLPQEILNHGNYAIAGRGRGRYAFVRIPRPNRFATPPNVRRERIISREPRWVGQYMGSDEQCMLSSVNTNDLVRRHLNLHAAFQLQAHRRTTVRGWGQVELDGWYVGEGENATHVGIAIEAKDEADGDRLNVAQLYGAALALRQGFGDLPVRLIGAKPTGNRRILMCEFSVPNEIGHLEPIGEWIEYELVVY